MPAEKNLADLCKEELWARRRWDEAPQLYTVRRNKLRPLPFPPSMWAGDPAAKLKALAESAQKTEIKRLFGDLVAHGCLGFAFRVEAWMTIQDAKDHPAVDANDPSTHTYNRAGGEPSKSPHRIEIRTLGAATTRGERLACIQRRDQGYRVEVLQQAHEGASDQTLAGRIPDALASLTHAMLSSHYEHGPEAADD